ncbi:MAG TPA: M28 family peptidase, partial [Desulfosarcina sp.]|nr:M28 family peptidase [Desulfosarcina sp.]
RGNAITPGTIAEPGLTGPLIYAGTGRLKELNGKPIEGAVILMELDSGKNWLHAANLGARALIYVDRGQTRRFFFEDKEELSPIQFPRFWMPESEARRIFGEYENSAEGKVADEVRLRSDTAWESIVAENLYWVIPGKDKALAEELLMVEAFYDSSAWVLGQSPGADEALGIATLLELARYFREHPPSRSVLMVATAGHAQALAGMRELFWSLRSKNLVLRREQKRLKQIQKDSRQMLEVLERGYLPPQHPDAEGRLLKDALDDELKTEVDHISRRLIALRMADNPDQTKIRVLARERLVLRRLGWRSTFEQLSEDEQAAVAPLIPNAARQYKAVLADVSVQLKNLTAAKRFRSVVKEKELAAVVSLHLSGHGDGVGAFSEGWLYTLKSQINRTGPYTAIAEIFQREHAGENHPDTAAYWDSLRPSPLRTWQSYFPDRPPLGGEVPALAGYVGLTIATVNDARAWWGTPGDTPERIDWEYARKQARRICGMMRSLTEAPTLYSDSAPRNGFATITARSRLLRHGELFPDQDASDVVVLAYQGPGKYHAMTDAMGMFTLKGVATKKLMLDKVILEGYRFDRDTGEVLWAIDKQQTGKEAYRVKMQRYNMETDLVVFPAKETTLFNLLEPRTFNYMTKIELLDGRREASPLRYWYSRIDTRASTITSIYLEPGTYLKLTHSDTVLQRKMILLNADAEDPQGTGYRIDDWPKITRTD